MRVPSQQEIQLVNTALYLRRPLLVTGDPGVGKSTLAYAVAHKLGLGPVMRWPITTRSTLYHYDLIGRLRENLRRIRGEALPAEEDDIGTQIRLRPSERHCWPYRRPRVLLIDEIDKSDIDLPNDLLNVFEEGEFDQRGHRAAPEVGQRDVRRRARVETAAIPLPGWSGAGATLIVRYSAHQVDHLVPHSPVSPGVPAHPWIMRVPGCASCHASIAASHSSPLREVSEAGKSPSSSLLMCSYRSDIAVRMACWPSGLEMSTVASSSASSWCSADQRSDVLGEHLLARHDPEQACSSPCQCEASSVAVSPSRRRAPVQVAAVDRAHSLPTEVGGTLVLRDVVAQQRHLPAPAVVAHFPLDTTGPRHLSCSSSSTSRSAHRLLDSRHQ